MVDDEGHLIWGDQLMILFARDILQAHPGATIIAEVKATKVLYDDIARLGGKPLMWKTGHSLIKKKIKEEKAALAGEMSGHIFFADRCFGFDDAIYASARLLELLARSDVKLSAMLADLPKTFTPPRSGSTPRTRSSSRSSTRSRASSAAKYPGDRHRRRAGGLSEGLGPGPGLQHPGRPGPALRRRKPKPTWPRSRRKSGGLERAIKKLKRSWGGIRN